MGRLSGRMIHGRRVLWVEPTMLRNGAVVLAAVDGRSIKTAFWSNPHSAWIGCCSMKPLTPQPYAVATIDAPDVKEFA